MICNQTNTDKMQQRFKFENRKKEKVPKKMINQKEKVTKKKKKHIYKDNENAIKKIRNKHPIRKKGLTV